MRRIQCFVVTACALIFGHAAPATAQSSSPIIVDGDHQKAQEKVPESSPLQGVIDGILQPPPPTPEPSADTVPDPSAAIDPAVSAQEAMTAETEEEEPLPEEPALYYYPAIKLRVLDKVTAQTETLEIQVGQNARFGSIFIRAQTCQKPPAIERKEASAFLQVWELDADEKSRWVFSGWMFASSPALSAMDHPVYDLWVLDCLGEPLNALKEPEEEPSQDTPKALSPTSQE